MKRFILSTLCFFILLTISQGQWTQTDGPYGQTFISDLEKVNTTLFATTGMGVYAKQDGAQRWKKISPQSVQLLNRTGDTLLYGYHQTLSMVDASNPGLGIYNFLYNNTHLPSFPQFAYKDSMLFITSNLGVYVSNDLGQTKWPFLSGLDVDTVTSGGNTFYVLKVTDIIASENFLFCATENGVYRSDYSLTQWERKTSFNSLKIYEGQNALYTISTDSLYMSTDQGDSWMSINGKSPYSVCELNGNIYATTQQGVITSIDSGKTWITLNAGLPSQIIRRVESLEGAVYCVESYGNIYKWNGNQWVKELQDGLISTRMRGIETTDSALYAIDESSGVFKYQHNNTWANVSPTYSNKIISFEDLRIYNDTLYSLIGVNDTATNQRYLDVCYSWDDGQNWTCTAGPMLNNTSSPIYYGLFKIFNGTFYFFDGSLILRTQDLNSPWENISPLFTTYHCPGYIYDLTYFNNKVYISGCDEGSLSYYDESQQTWVEENITFLVGQQVNLISLRDTFLFAHSPDGVYRRSTSNNFYTKVGSLDTMNLYATDYLNIGKSLYVTAHDGLYRSTDHGLTWSSLNTGLPDNWGTVDVGAYNDTLFLALYDYGVFKHPLLQDPISIEEVNTGKQDVSIFPNPAKDWVTVTLTQAETDASFSISDQTGKLLLFGKLDESGKINTSSLAKGNYVLSLQTSSGIKTTKLIIAE